MYTVEENISCTKKTKAKNPKPKAEDCNSFMAGSQEKKQEIQRNSLCVDLRSE